MTSARADKRQRNALCRQKFGNNAEIDYRLKRYSKDDAEGKQPAEIVIAPADYDYAENNKQNEKQNYKTDADKAKFLGYYGEYKIRGIFGQMAVFAYSLAKPLADNSASRYGDKRLLDLIAAGLLGRRVRLRK